MTNTNGVDINVEMDRRFSSRVGDLIVSAEKRAAAREVEADFHSQRADALEEENVNLRNALQEVRDELTNMKADQAHEGDNDAALSPDVGAGEGEQGG